MGRVANEGVRRGANLSRLVESLSSGDRSASALSTTVNSLYALRNRPDRLGSGNAHQPLRLAIDAAFSISEPSKRCWLDLGWSQQKLLGELLCPDGALFSLVMDLQHAPKVQIPIQLLPIYAQQYLRANRELPPSPFYNGRSILGIDYTELSLFEYFLVGLASYFQRTAQKRSEPDRVDFAAHLLQDYLDYFIPLRVDDMWPEQQAFFNYRCQRGKEMLSLFSEWWMRPIMSGPRDPDVLMPRKLVLEAIRRVSLHVIVIPDEPRLYEFIDVIQRPLFQFFHILLSRWPLEQLRSLRSVVELWLSWIEPWNADCSRASLDLPSASQFRQYPPKDTKIKTDFVFWSRYVHHNIMFYSVLLADFLGTSLHLDFTKSSHLSQLSMVLHTFRTPELISIVHDCESKLGILHNANSSYGRRHFMDISAVEPSLFVPLSSPRSQTYSLAGRVWASLRIADERLQELARERESDPEQQRLMHEQEAKAPKGTLAELFGSKGDKETKLGRHRSVQQLTQSRSEIEQNCADLQAVFELDLRSFVGEDTMRLRKRHSYGVKEVTPEQSNARLTERGRDQVRSGRAICSRLDVPVVGSCWELPATSLEDPRLLLLMRHLHNITSLNLRFLANRVAFAFFVVLLVIFCFVLSRF